MKKIFFKTKRFILRNLRISDVDTNYLNWFKDKQNANYIAFDPKNNLEILKENVKKQLLKKNTIFLGIFNFKKEHLGNIKFDNFNKTKSSCDLGILIGTTKWKNRGVGSEVIQESANYLYKNYKISKVYLGVYLDNTRALRFFKSCGFVIVKKKISNADCYKKKIKPRAWFYMCRDYYRSKIAIGTAQLGLNYGITNKSGKIPIIEMEKIKKLAEKKGINTIETAESYGESENRLGKINIKNFKIITKLPVSIPEKNIEKWVFKSIKSSIKKLKINKLHGLLIHNTNQLTEKFGNKIYKSLLKAKKQNLVDKIGISIYSMKELKLILSKYKFDIVSTPFNIIDQRVKKSGWINKLKKLKIDVYVRSIFLQGSLLQNKNKRPRIFKKWSKLFNKWDQIVYKSGQSRLEICLSFVMKNPEIDKVILGFDTYKQFHELTEKVKPLNISSSSLIASNDTMLINPSNWRLL